VGESILVQVTRLFAHALHRRVSSVPEKANGAGLKYCGKDSRLVAGVTQTAGDLRELSHGAVGKSDGGIFSGRSIYESTFFCLTGYLVGFFLGEKTDDTSKQENSHNISTPTPLRDNGTVRCRGSWRSSSRWGVEK
jgi:hypothetical protein